MSKIGSVSDDALLEWATNVELECSMERDTEVAIGGGIVDLKDLRAILRDVAHRRGLYEPPAETERNAHKPETKA